MSTPPIPYLAKAAIGLYNNLTTLCLNGTLDFMDVIMRDRHAESQVQVINAH